MAEDGRLRLKSNPYPGRGIILGLDDTGRYAMQIYWITARSEGSRNRILEIDGEDVRTQPFDPAERANDPNIWYRAIGHVGAQHVVSNGVHTDTIIDFLRHKRPFAEAVRTTSYETDEPNFTPRIAGMTELSEGRVQASFGMAFRHSSGHAQHNVYGCQPDPGMGRCFHTYAEDGDPVPAYTSRPYDIDLPGTPEEAAASVWDELLPADKRVALALKVIDVGTGEVVMLDVKNQRG